VLQYNLIGWRKSKLRFPIHRTSASEIVNGAWLLSVRLIMIAFDFKLLRVAA
jgi:hypothetical protein